jgi:predicted naringenin-chalcone synthase
VALKERMANGLSFVLSDFKPVRLEAPVAQEHLLNYTAWLMATARCASMRTSTNEEAARVLEDVQAQMRRYAVGADLIDQRQFNAFPGDLLRNEATRGDASPGDPSRDGAQEGSWQRLGQNGAPEIPPWLGDIVSQPEGGTLDTRMRFFESVALQVFQRWYEGRSDAPDDVIHVTCSGYASPSPAQRAMVERQWHDTTVTHSYHMGCYGAFPAMRMAAGFLASSTAFPGEPKRRIDIVHTEHLSVHLPMLKCSPGDIVNTTLFADGFIGYSAYLEEVFRHRGGTGLRVLAQLDQLIPDSLEDMTWRLGPHQFDMHLSKDVPVLIRDAVLQFVRRLCARAGLNFDRERERIVFAIHPGGPKILDHIQERLGILPEQLHHARSIFKTLGNMSSATVPHILMEVLKDEAVAPGTPILSMGFGPGLTATGLVLEKV